MTLTCARPKTENQRHSNVACAGPKTENQRPSAHEVPGVSPVSVRALHVVRERV